MSAFSKKRDRDWKEPIHVFNNSHIPPNKKHRSCSQWDQTPDMKTCSNETLDYERTPGLGLTPIGNCTPIITPTGFNQTPRLCCSNIQTINFLNLAPKTPLEPAKLQDTDQLSKLLNQLSIANKSKLKPLIQALMRNINCYDSKDIFGKIFTLLMEATLQDEQKRNLITLLTKLISTIGKDIITPLTHKICIVVQPLLIDENYIDRQQGKNLIKQLCKKVDLAEMLPVIRSDIESVDEYIRNVTTRTIAVMTDVFGIPLLLPFLKAVCKSKKSWVVKHCGIKMIQQIAKLIPDKITSEYLKQFLEMTQNGLQHNKRKIRQITALTIAALARCGYDRKDNEINIQHFQYVLGAVSKRVSMQPAQSAPEYVQAYINIILLMDGNIAEQHMYVVMPKLCDILSIHNDKHWDKLVLRLYKKCPGNFLRYLLQPGYDEKGAKYIYKKIIDNVNLRESEVCIKYLIDANTNGLNGLKYLLDVIEKDGKLMNSLSKYIQLFLKITKKDIFCSNSVEEQTKMIEDICLVIGRIRTLGLERNGHYLRIIVSMVTKYKGWITNIWIKKLGIVINQHYTNYDFKLLMHRLGERIVGNGIPENPLRISMSVE